jgi:hypothetical protein
MEALLIIIFVLGYLAIALEHTIRVDKAASALLLGGICWTLLVLSGNTFFPGILPADVTHSIEHGLAEHLSEISSILFFLLGAMTIVELIDAHGGFRVITDRIHTVNRVSLLWIIGILTFFLYLSDVEEGGETEFPLIDLKVQPKRGKAILWPSVQNQNLLVQEGRTNHAALPVVKGLKYAANSWIHLYDFQKSNLWGCTGAFDYL